MSTDVSLVYVTEHDDPDVAYVVNSYEEERQNYVDMVDDGVIEPGFELAEYLSHVVMIMMPTALYQQHPSPASIAWLDAHL